MPDLDTHTCGWCGTTRGGPLSGVIYRLDPSLGRTVNEWVCHDDGEPGQESCYEQASRFYYPRCAW